MSYRVYPVTQTELDCKDYRVKINGENIQLNSARVSAEPFNRYWPGHQRQIEQTELINFASFALDAPVEMEIIPAEPFERLDIRPASAKILSTVTDDGRILLHLDKPQYFTVEPYGRNRALHVFADPMPQYEIDRNDPNLLYFGKGEHDLGVLELKSNQTLYLDEGAVVYARIIATNAENIRILGRGILDNSHSKEEILFEATQKSEKEWVHNAIRHHAIQFAFCNGIEIDGITVRDSLEFTICPTACRHVTLRNVKIIGNWRYNSDGIDMHNCCDTLIENCFLRTFDDCLCAKGLNHSLKKEFEEKGYAPDSYEYFKNLHVKNCVLWNDWGKSLEIGLETCAEEMCDFLFEDCDIIHVTSDALDCMNGNYADIHDVTYRNIRVEFDDIVPQPKVQKTDAMKYPEAAPDPDYAPILIGVRVKHHHLFSGKEDRLGVNRNITFEDISLMGRHRPRLVFQGCDAEHGCHDIVIKDLYHNGKKLTSEQDYDLSTDEFCQSICVE